MTQEVNVRDSSRRPVVVLMCLGFTTLAGFWTTTVPTRPPHLEPSLFVDFIPQLTFLFLAFGSGSLGVLFHQKMNRSVLGLLPYVLVLASSSSYLVLPLVNGYYFYGRGDALSHLAIIDGASISGFLPRDDYYPMTHAWMLSLAETIGLDPRIVFMMVPVLLQSVFAISACLAVGVRFGSVPSKVTFVLASTPFLGNNHIYLTPAYVSYVLVVLFFWIFVLNHRRRRLGFSVLLVVITLSLPFVHPLTAIMVLGFLVILGLLHRVKAGSVTPGGRRVSSSVGNLALILGMEWVGWFSAFAIWGQSLGRVLAWLEGELANSLAAHNLSLASRYGILGLDVVALLAKKYGAAVVLTVVAYASILEKLWKNRRSSATSDRLILQAHFAFAVVIGTLFVVNMFTFQFVDAFRPLWILAIFAVPMLGVAILRLAKQEIVPAGVKEVGQTGRRPGLLRATIVLSVWVGLVVVLAFATAHPSPVTLEPNEAVTLAEVQMSGWTGAHIEPGSSIFCQSACHRLWEAAGDPASVDKFRFANTPAHFEFMLTASTSDSFLLIYEFDRVTYTGVWGFAHKFDPDDFAWAESEWSVIYSNGSDSVLLLTTP